MKEKGTKLCYDAATVEILLLNKVDIITASDLFTESEAPGDSSSSNGWT